MNKLITKKTIRLPRFLIPLLDEEETNAKSRDYALRTAIPTLETYVLSPFATALKDPVFERAKQHIGLDDDGVLKSDHVEQIELDGRRFIVTCSPAETASYQTVLNRTKIFLDKVIADNKDGVHREGVRKDEFGANIHIDYLLGEVSRLKKDATSRYNRTELEMKDSEGKRPALLASIAEMRVILTPHATKPTDANANDFYRAKSLKKRIDDFVKEYDETIMTNYAHDDEDSIVTEFPDGTSLRHLFFPKTSTEHGEIYSGLVGKKTAQIASSTGDLTIVKELAFTPRYAYKQGKIEVRTDAQGNSGTMGILRTTKEGDNLNQYHLLAYDGRTYVCVTDILATLAKLEEAHTDTTPQLKVDFFPSPPDYLK